MPDAISNTSPLFYLHRVGALEWLPRLFTEIWVPGAVIRELHEGRRRGHDTPKIEDHPWLRTVEPVSAPSEWLSLDLGAGELAALTLALENPDRIVLLDDGLARRLGQAAGLTVWGTLKVLLEVKSLGLTESVAPLLLRLEEAGMWMSHEIRRRVLALAGEDLQ